MLTNKQLVVLVVLSLTLSVCSRLVDFCGPPRCNTQQEIQTLQVASDPAFFYQCAYNASGFHVPVLRPCARTTFFAYHQQFCVPAAQWTDACDGSPTSTTSTTMTPTTTTEMPAASVCTVPTCTIAREVNVQHPTSNPEVFYYCLRTANGTHIPVAAMCSKGSFFSFQQQACVPTHTWQDPCQLTWQPNCARPDCSQVVDFLNLHPSVNPNQYFQCTLSNQGVAVSELIFCLSGLHFDFRQQACVIPDIWSDTCPLMQPYTD